MIHETKEVAKEVAKVETNTQTGNWKINLIDMNAKSNKIGFAFCFFRLFLHRSFVVVIIIIIFFFFFIFLF